MAWIRSQDKKSLTATKDVWISSDNELFGSKRPFGEYENPTVLGKFKTVEAALEELDRIAQWIVNGASGIYQISKL